MTRFVSVFALALFIPLHAFAQTPVPANPAPAAGALNQAKSATAAAGAKADSMAGTAATQAKGTANAGAATAQAGATDSAKAVDKAGAKAQGAAAKLVDLNSATVDELKAIPTLAPVADKIVAARPFANKAQLVSKKILDKAGYEQVKNLVIAKKAK